MRPAGDDTGREPAPGPHELYREKMREQRREKSRLAAFLSWFLTGSLFAGLTAAGFFFRNEVVRAWPQSAIVYSMFGLDVNRFGLDFEAVVHTRTFNDTIPIVTVTGRAVNVSKAEVETPAVRVDLKDEAGQVVATRYSFITPGDLTPGGAGQFGVVIEPAPAESFEIELAFVERSEVPRLPPGDPMAEDLPADGAADEE